MSEEIESVVAEIFIEVFEWGALPPIETIHQEAMPSWDSMKQLNLVTAIESEFEVTFDLDTAISITSFTKAIDVIAAHTS